MQRQEFPTETRLNPLRLSTHGRPRTHETLLFSHKKWQPVSPFTVKRVEKLLSPVYTIRYTVWNWNSCIIAYFTPTLAFLIMMMIIVLIPKFKYYQNPPVCAVVTEQLVFQILMTHLFQASDVTFRDLTWGMFFPKSQIFLSFDKNKSYLKNNYSSSILICSYFEKCHEKPIRIFHMRQCNVIFEALNFEIF